MIRTYPSQPQVGVGAVVFQRDAVLLVRRRNPPLAGSWIVPGGLVELGETLEQAVIREVREETGWRVSVAKLVTLLDYLERDERGAARYHYVIADYLCRYVRGELVAGSDVTEVRLVPLSELQRYGLTKKALEVIHRARQMEKVRAQRMTTPPSEKKK